MFQSEGRMHCRYVQERALQSIMAHRQQVLDTERMPGGTAHSYLTVVWICFWTVLDDGWSANLSGKPRHGRHRQSRDNAGQRAVNGIVPSEFLVEPQVGQSRLIRRSLGQQAWNGWLLIGWQRIRVEIENNSIFNHHSRKHQINTAANHKASDTEFALIRGARVGSFRAELAELPQRRAFCLAVIEQEFFPLCTHPMNADPSRS